MPRNGMRSSRTRCRTGEHIVFKPHPNGIQLPDNVFKRRHDVAGLKHNVFNPVNNDARLKYHVSAAFHIVSWLKYIVLTVRNNGLRSSNNVATPLRTGSGAGQIPAGHGPVMAPIPADEPPPA